MFSLLFRVGGGIFLRGIPTKLPVNSHQLLLVVRSHGRNCHHAGGLAAANGRPSGEDEGSRLDIYTALWPNITPPTSIHAAARQLHHAPKGIEEWKESAARAGAGMVLAHGQAHFPKSEGLDMVEGGAPIMDDEEVNVAIHLPIFRVAASKVATFLALKVFVEETKKEEEG